MKKYVIYILILVSIMQTSCVKDTPTVEQPPIWFMVEYIDGSELGVTNREDTLRLVNLQNDVVLTTKFDSVNSRQVVDVKSLCGLEEVTVFVERGLERIGTITFDFYESSFTGNCLLSQETDSDFELISVGPFGVYVWIRR